MKNFTSRQQPGIFFAFIVSILFLSASLIPQQLLAQNGSPCYKPIIGPGTSAATVGSGVTIGFSSGNGINNLTNGNTGDFAEINNLASLVGSQGVSVTNSKIDYPAGWYAGFVVDLGDNGLLNANVLGGIQISTYKDGNPTAVETQTFNNGIGLTLISTGSPDRTYLSFKTTAAFDEVRITKGGIANAAVGSSTLRIYYAMAFDPLCGTLDNNSICEDQIAGNQTIVNFSGGVLNAVSTLTNPQFIIDGDKKTAGSLLLPAGTDLTTNAPYVGVKSLQTIYQAGGGRRVGFVIQQTGSLLSVDVLNSLRIQTYLHGVMQDDIALGGATALVGATVLSGTSAVQKVSIPTTAGKNYNEVRLVVAQTASVDVGTLNIYYAFESGATCTDCEQLLAAGGTYPTSSIVNARTGGNFCVGLGSARVDDENLVVDNNYTGNFARIRPPLLGVGCEGSISVRDSSGSPGRVIPANSFAGFVISKNGNLLDLGILSGIRIRTYKGGSLRDDSNNMGTSLLGLSVLSGGTGLTKVGIKTTLDYDEIRITVDFGVLGTFVTSDAVRVYYAFVQRDDDNDGVFDCNEVCGTGAGQDDSVDSDGDGTPNSCDNCSTVNAKASNVDTDGDGLFNNCDDDSDNDGIPDAIEDTDTDSDPNDNDADGDGIPNYLDLDSDNDGILDIYESGVTVGGGDANNNGAFDNAVHTTTNTPKDTDGDGVPDYLDLDADNDAIFDLYEGGGTGYTDADTDGVIDGPDADNDGIQDSADANDAAFGFPSSNTPKDQDVDGVPDYRDLDSDNDGINDIIESGKTGLTDANNDGIVDGPDADGDGIRDSADSDDVVFGSPGGSTPVDTDGDNVADYRDLDSDNDTISDLVESGQTGYTDADDDGVVEGPDADGDGIQDSVDGNDGAFGDAGSPAPKNTDSANDNIPDYRDPDSDNDGTNDIVENGRGGLDPNNDGKVDNPTDPDGDGIANNEGLDFKPNDFGGLGSAASDLTPVILSNGGTYNQNQERDVVVRIINNGTESTSAPVVFFIPKLDPAFSITIDSTATSAAVFGTTPVANPEWTFEEQGTRFKMTLKNGFSILGGGANKQIVIKVKATGPKTSTATISAQIQEGTGGGENPITNNIVTYQLSINL